MNRPCHRRPRCTAGIALLAVLVFVALGSAATIVLVDRVAVEVMTEARARRQEQLRHEADAAG